MKRVISVVMLLILTMALCSCGKKQEADPVKDELIQYIEVQLAGIKDNEDIAIQKYNQISASLSSMKTAEIVLALNDEVIAPYSEFNTALQAITVTTPEVTALKNTYVEGSNLQLQGLKEFVAAVENNDTEAAKAANDKISQGRDKIEQHRNDLMKLATDHDLIYQSDNSTQAGVDLGTDSTDDVSDVTTEAVQ